MTKRASSLCCVAGGDVAAPSGLGRGSMEPPDAEGMPIKVVTFDLPPDWPWIITRSGSPPKASIFSRTHLAGRTARTTVAFNRPQQLHIPSWIAAGLDSHGRTTSCGSSEPSGNSPAPATTNVFRLVLDRTV